MIVRYPTPITQAVQTLQALIDASVDKPDVRMLAKTILDSIEASTMYLWSDGNLEHADRDRLMEDALQFYASGGNDGGQRAKRVFDRWRT